MKSLIQAKIEEKARQLEELKEIQNFTEVLAQQLDDISEKLDVMNDCSESVALILSNWKDISSSVALASLGLAKHARKSVQDSEVMPKTLVRIKLQPESSTPEK